MMRVEVNADGTLVCVGDNAFRMRQIVSVWLSADDNLIVTLKCGDSYRVAEPHQEPHAIQLKLLALLGFPATRT